MMCLIVYALDYKHIFEYAVASSLTKNHPFIGLKGTLTPKPDVKHQPAIDSDEAHAMLGVLMHSNDSKIVKLYIELLAHLFVSKGIQTINSLRVSMNDFIIQDNI